MNKTVLIFCLTLASFMQLISVINLFSAGELVFAKILHNDKLSVYIRIGVDKLIISSKSIFSKNAKLNWPASENS